ncbi:MAG: hypothetical protein A2087_10250 [Spirochaetes bacterium GWD1_61_31]|nr:MAG: hypothetical protein A2Y37_12265 [Spirochaetes bacterium GWB1_60_80]OHD30147.1 MAG: hypothetical protein A2004_14130 [Spirochaetes bacterium GWC1_61_12]OHD34598.1 MAG: hypothetical protein A2087_10250 [Spirochaetes bacterium GWD1_61_31]OHD46414.1 MAG: hypothetical protein A2Y35_10155 [Spirochaetes bacterium GWE1_60_18]OHD59470.1 MAG: hypothetical protein A2Y32_10110 [Spirochaetes bacterium GWF1_60_12]HAP43536.1 hypothetical protein [Spirochaetaceae bacterium]
MMELVWFLMPVLVGAVIGLFTNWLAIKMLFRPRYEKRFLGIRIPFTPGILPRERQRLAASLGATAAGDLITEEVLVAKIRSPDFHQSLQAAVLDGQHAFYAASLDLGNNANASPALQLARDMLGAALKSIGSSGIFEAAASQALRLAMEELEGLPLSSVITDDTLAALTRLLSDRHTAPRLAATITKALDEQLQKALAADACLADFVRLDQLPASVSQIFHYLWPFVSQKIVAILREPHLRGKLETTGALLVSRIIEKLNSVQRFFIGLGGYERSILQSMPAIIDDFTATVEDLLQKPETQAELLEWLLQQLQDFMQKPCRQLAIINQGEQRRILLGKTEAALSSVLQSLNGEQLVGALGNLVRKQTFSGLFELFPQLQGVLASSIGAWLASLLSGGTGAAHSASKVMQAFFQAFLSLMEGRPLGSLLAVDEANAVRFADLAANAIAGLAATQSARILQSVDVHRLVQDRINDLDIVTIERMILRVMDRELRAVTWFGALLGGLMGLAQSVLNLLR